MAERKKKATKQHWRNHTRIFCSEVVLVIGTSHFQSQMANPGVKGIGNIIISQGKAKIITLIIIIIIGINNKIYHP